MINVSTAKRWLEDYRRAANQVSTGLSRMADTYQAGADAILAALSVHIMDQVKSGAIDEKIVWDVIGITPRKKHASMKKHLKNMQENYERQRSELVEERDSLTEKSSGVEEKRDAINKRRNEVEEEIPRQHPFKGNRGEEFAQRYAKAIGYGGTVGNGSIMYGLIETMVKKAKEFENKEWSIWNSSGRQIASLRKEYPEANCGQSAFDACRRYIRLTKERGVALKEEQALIDWETKTISRVSEINEAIADIDADIAIFRKPISLNKVREEILDFHGPNDLAQIVNRSGGEVLKASMEADFADIEALQKLKKGAMADAAVYSEMALNLESSLRKLRGASSSSRMRSFDENGFRQGIAQLNGVRDRIDAALAVASGKVVDEKLQAIIDKAATSKPQINTEISPKMASAIENRRYRQDTCFDINMLTMIYLYSVIGIDDANDAIQADTPLGLSVFGGAIEEGALASVAEVGSSFDYDGVDTFIEPLRIDMGSFSTSSFDASSSGSSYDSGSSFSGGDSGGGCDF